VAGAYVSLLLIHLHFPEAGSLKAKRKDLASLKAQLHTRLHVAVAEVGHHDAWQRSTVAAAAVAGTATGAEQQADRVERFVLERFPEGARFERTLSSFDELAG
jgi:uncharacterized protein